ncbi:MAG: hypothetical protein H6672_21965 [Anaerolineaceae bacterium]|nr:hypothetical protein [Anaerolineaceae bacterium]
MMGLSSEQELWLPLLDQIALSVQYPFTGEAISEAVPDVVSLDIPGWQYAVNVDTQTLIAYQINGDTRDLLPSVNDFLS